MPKTIRRGDRGQEVEDAQALLNDQEGIRPSPLLEEDGIFGAKTETAVSNFQAFADILVDGIVGPVTWDALGYEPDDDDEFEDTDVLGWEKCPAVKGVNDEGDTSVTLREDVAVAYMKVYDVVSGLGGKMTSSGGRRSLTANVGSNRSATSLHYLGRALDLHVYSGMHAPETDPYVIEPDPEHSRKWIVWARVQTGGEERAIDAWHHPSQQTRRVTGRFVNLTELFDSYGFKRISARSSYSPSNYGASEWWHFQNTLGLQPRVTKWGDELLRVYTRAELENTPPWKYRNGLWQVDWF